MKPPATRTTNPKATTVAERRVRRDIRARDERKKKCQLNSQVIAREYVTYSLATEEFRSRRARRCLPHQYHVPKNTSRTSRAPFGSLFGSISRRPVRSRPYTRDLPCPVPA